MNTFVRSGDNECSLNKGERLEKKTKGSGSPDPDRTDGVGRRLPRRLTASAARLRAGGGSGGSRRRRSGRGRAARRGGDNGGDGDGRRRRLRELVVERISSELETPVSAFGWLRGAPSVRFDEKEGWGQGYLKEGGVEEGQRKGRRPRRARQRRRTRAGDGLRLEDGDEPDRWVPPVGG